MSILEEEVWIVLNSKTINHYEDLGYNIPKIKDKQGIMRIPRGTRILVKTKDLTIGSNVNLTKICDNSECDVEGGRKVLNQKYSGILRDQKENNGANLCHQCGKIKGAKTRSENIQYKDCIMTTHPNIASLLEDKKLGYNLTSKSGKKASFVCPKCNISVGFKIVANVTKQGLSCPRCSDGISYPEKFMFNMLTQLNLDFEYQKTFGWSKKVTFGINKIGGSKIYDFYDKSMNCIIEVHGKQHYECGFDSYGGRSAKDEQENDALKESLARSNGITNYFVIDCRESKLEYVKNSILQSGIDTLFELNSIDWLKCHKFACKSLIKIACELWNNGVRSSKDIGKIMKIDKHTAIRYLKQGVSVGWCDYDPSTAIISSRSKNQKKNGKPVVALTMNGEYVGEFESGKEAGRALKVSDSHISTVCLGERKSAGGFKWMYKDDYESKSATY